MNTNQPLWKELSKAERIGFIGSLVFSLLTVLFIYLGFQTSFSFGLYIGYVTVFVASCFQAVYWWRRSKAKAILPIIGGALLIALVILVF